MATAQRDYYEILGVPRDADDRTIKSAFRRLALKYHPDRSKEEDAEARFKEIVEAYAVLSDPKRRGEYDAAGLAGVAGLTPEDLFAGIDLGDLLGSFGFGAGGGLFERLFGAARRRGPSRGRDVEAVLAVPLVTVATGGEETVTIRRPVACTSCGGSGARAGTAPRVCDACGGTGERTTRSRQGNVVVQQVAACPACGGRGTVIDDPCPVCGGTGEVTRSEGVKVRIPPGVEEGTALRIPGRGIPSPEPGGAAGDAYVVIETIPDPRFVRRGADLWHTTDVDVTDAVLGTKRRIPTADGEVVVTVPPGTQPDTVVRIAGKGLPRFGRHGRGDLYVSIGVHVPERLSAPERRLWERLRSSRPTGGR